MTKRHDPPPVHKPWQAASRTGTLQPKQAASVPPGISPNHRPLDRWSVGPVSVPARLAVWAPRQPHVQVLHAAPKPAAVAVQAKPWPRTAAAPGFPVFRGTIQPLGELFGLDQWSPTGTVRNHTRAEFEGIRAGGRTNWTALSPLIPSACSNQFEFEARTQRGFKFEWTDPNGSAWHVHGHEPDAGAGVGHIGAAGWVVRIRNDGDWLLSATYPMVVPGTGTVNVDWSRSRGGAVAALSHIPFDP